MAEKAKCEVCNKFFKNKEGLDQHNTAKHSVNADKIVSAQNNLSNIGKKTRNYLIFAIILALIIWAVFSSLNSSNQCSLPAKDINIESHQNLALHIHSDLTIIINGISQTIPANIGIAPNIMRPLHTHDLSGEVHNEGPCVRSFTLGEFFEIWGKQFNKQCIFDNCISNGSLSMSVNGKDSKEFDSLVLKDDDKIIIEYFNIKAQ